MNFLKFKRRKNKKINHLEIKFNYIKILKDSIFKRLHKKINND